MEIDHLNINIFTGLLLNNVCTLLNIMEICVTNNDKLNIHPRGCQPKKSSLTQRAKFKTCYVICNQQSLFQAELVWNFLHFISSQPSVLVYQFFHFFASPNCWWLIANTSAFLIKQYFTVFPKSFLKEFGSESFVPKMFEKRLGILQLSITVNVWILNWL